MPRIIQFRRGTTTGLASVLGAAGEIFVDTSLVTVVVHNGVTTGGTTLARNADVQTLSSTTATNIATLSSNTVSSIAYLSSVAAALATSSTVGNVRPDNSSLTISGGVMSVLTPTTYFTSYTTGSGNWTKPPTGSMVLVRMWGAGGSGGRANLSTLTTAGGGGGAFKEILYRYSDLGSTISYGVGAGGVARSTVSNGAPGGNTTFGSGTAYGGGGGGYDLEVPGGGGGGVLGAGGTATGIGGAPDGGFLASNVLSTEGGSVFGGGNGGTSNNDWRNGGRSVWGGGGGGAGGQGGQSGAGGSSGYGGAGGAGATTAGGTGISGTAPGGGGGGSGGTGTSGAGGDGRIEIYVW